VTGQPASRDGPDRVADVALSDATVVGEAVELVSELIIRGQACRDGHSRRPDRRNIDWDVRRGARLYRRPARVRACRRSLIIDDVIAVTGAQQFEEIETAFGVPDAQPGEVLVANLGAKAVGGFVASARIVNCDPVGVQQTRTEHITGLGEEVVLARGQQADHLAGQTAFRTVFGLSLAPRRGFRFPCKSGAGFTFQAQPRSVLMTGEARRIWELSIPPVQVARYPITFRTITRPERRSRSAGDLQEPPDARLRGWKQHRRE